MTQAVGLETLSMATFWTTCTERTAKHCSVPIVTPGNSSFATVSGAGLSGASGLAPAAAAAGGCLAAAGSGFDATR